MVEVWVIEYINSVPPCWIKAEPRHLDYLDVTYQRKLAARFTSHEDASHEILRLGLSQRAWKANRIPRTGIQEETKK